MHSWTPQENHGFLDPPRNYGFLDPLGGPETHVFLGGPESYVFHVFPLAPRGAPLPVVAVGASRRGGRPRAKGAIPCNSADHGPKSMPPAARKMLNGTVGSYPETYVFLGGPETYVILGGSRNLCFLGGSRILCFSWGVRPGGTFLINNRDLHRVPSGYSFIHMHAPWGHIPN